MSNEVSAASLWETLNFVVNNLQHWGLWAPRAFLNGKKIQHLCTLYSWRKRLEKHFSFYSITLENYPGRSWPREQLEITMHRQVFRFLTSKDTLGLTQNFSPQTKLFRQKVNMSDDDVLQHAAIPIGMLTRGYDGLKFSCFFFFVGGSHVKSWCLEHQKWLTNFF